MNFNLKHSCLNLRLPQLQCLLLRRIKAQLYYKVFLLCNRLHTQTMASKRQCNITSSHISRTCSNLIFKVISSKSITNSRTSTNRCIKTTSRLIVIIKVITNSSRCISHLISSLSSTNRSLSLHNITRNCQPKTLLKENNMETS